jgi:hypothetical protein
MSSLFYKIDGSFYNNSLVTKNKEHMTPDLPTHIKNVMIIVSQNSYICFTQNSNIKDLNPIIIPKEVQYIQVEMVGGGGGGAGSGSELNNMYNNIYDGGGGGGGAGGYIKFILNINEINMYNTDFTSFIIGINGKINKERPTLNASGTDYFTLNKNAYDIKQDTQMKIYTPNIRLGLIAGGGYSGYLGNQTKPIIPGNGGIGGKISIKKINANGIAESVTVEDMKSSYIVKTIGQPLCIYGGSGGNPFHHYQSNHEFTGGSGGVSFFGGGGTSNIDPTIKPLKLPWGAGGSGAGVRTNNSQGATLSTIGKGYDAQQGQTGIVIISYKVLIKR